jgi:hypothetical protein
VFHRGPVGASRAMGLAAGLLMVRCLLGAEDDPGRRAFPSLQGFTGLLNTPNALVTAEGTGDLQYSNQTETPYRQQVPWTDNYTLSFGLFPYLEGGARLMNRGPLNRDFSDNLKLQLPFLPAAFPKLAIGFQDFGGAATFLRTNYGVATQDLGPLRLSLGYGTGPARMKGLFGGAELFLTPWLQVLGEHDGSARNAGLRLSTPPGWLPSAVSLGALFKVGSNPQGQRGDLAVFLKVPLGHASRRTHGTEQPDPAKTPLPGAPSPQSPQAPAQGVPPADPGLSSLSRALTDLGFEQVRVGTQGGTLVLQYENHRYNHNQLDGLGVLLGTALAAAPDSLSGFRVAVHRQGLRVLEVSGPVAPFRDFFQNAGEPGPAELTHLAELVQIVSSASFRDLPGVDWLEPAPARGLRSELLLYPGLDKTLGTEVGVLDYRLSLMADWKLQLWPGGGLNARWDQPVAWSDDFRKGGIFETKGTEGRLDRVMLMQAVPLLPSLMTQFSFGQYLYRSKGWMNETVWIPGSGQHQFQLTSGQFRVSDDALTKVLLGTYRLYLPQWDTALEATAGSFYNRDRGYRLDLKRFFGDTALSVFYAKTSQKILGLALTVPLTPRRDLPPAAVQVRGWEHWPLNLYTVIKDPSQANYLAPGLAQVPDTPHSLREATYDDSRLNASYVKEHLARLREAYLRWKP